MSDRGYDAVIEAKVKLRNQTHPFINGAETDDHYNHLFRCSKDNNGDIIWLDYCGFGCIYDGDHKNERCIIF